MGKKIVSKVCQEKKLALQRIQVVFHFAVIFHVYSVNFLSPSAVAKSASTFPPRMSSLSHPMTSCNPRHRILFLQHL